MRRFAAFAFAAVLVVSIQYASAQIISFDENGNGSIILTPVVTPLPVTIAAPPVYHLAPVLGYVPAPGDVIVTEVTSAAPSDSDLLRLDPNGNLTVFSDFEPNEPPPVDLADVGVPPPSTQFPVVTFPENTPGGGPGIEGVMNGLYGYTPAPGSGLPGAPPAGVGRVIYNFTSDSVPEPASISLIGIAVSALLMRHRRSVGSTL